MQFHHNFVLDNFLLIFSRNKQRHTGDNTNNLTFMKEHIQNGVILIKFEFFFDKTTQITSKELFSHNVQIHR